MSPDPLADISFVDIVEPGDVVVLRAQPGGLTPEVGDAIVALLPEGAKVFVVDHDDAIAIHDCASVVAAIDRLGSPPP